MYEQKYDDEVVGRSFKDDAKQQHFEARAGTKQAAPMFHEELTDKLHIGEGQVANRSLAPLIQPAVLQSEKQSLHHVSAIENQFGSVHQPRTNSTIASAMPVHHQRVDIMNTTTVIESTPMLQVEMPRSVAPIIAAPIVAAPVKVAEPTLAPINSSPAILAPVPVVAEVSNAIREDSKMVDQFMHIEPKEHDSTAETKEAPSVITKTLEKASLPTSVEGAKAKVMELKETATTMFHEKIEPQLLNAKTMLQDKTESLTETITAQIKQTKDNLVKPKDVSTKHYTASKPQAENMDHRLRRYRSMAMQFYNEQEPIVRKYVEQGVSWIRANKLEIPAIALATLLGLWMSVSLISWIAFPTVVAPREQMVLYDASIGTNPLQDVPNAGSFDRFKMNMHESAHDMKLKATDRLGHLADAVPSVHMPTMPSVHLPAMHDIKLQAQDKLGHIKDAMPSMPHMSMPAMHSMPSMNDIKLQATDKLHHAKDALGAAMPGRLSDDMNSAPHQHTRSEPEYQGAGFHQERIQFHMEQLRSLMEKQQPGSIHNGMYIPSNLPASQIPSPMGSQAYQQMMQQQAASMNMPHHHHADGSIGINQPIQSQQIPHHHHVDGSIGYGAPQDMSAINQEAADLLERQRIAREAHTVIPTQ